MKKYQLLLILPLLMTASAFAQTKDNVARECVLFEVFTGVNCPYCPAAANGIGQMLDEGLAIAPVAYHTSAFSTPLYYTTETNARANYYSITSYPTLKADGILSVSGGGSASQSMYSTYLNRYNQRINQPSPFTIDLSYGPDEGNLCRVNCTVTQVGECSGSNVRVFIALTQCNIDVSWQGMQGLHHVCRDMIPTQMGTVFTGQTMNISETFELNYPKEDCYLTAWVQDYTTKEVYQAVRMTTLMDLDYDLVLKNVDGVITQNCSGTQHPMLEVKNLGHETITSFDMYAWDGQQEHRQTWNGTLPQGETVIVQMDDFVAADCSALDFVVSMPNGQEDGFMSDNQKTIQLEDVSTINGYVKIQAKSGKNYQNESIVVTDMNTGEVFETLTFEQASHAYTFELVLPNASCYCIAAKDSTGEGWGTGFFQVKDANNNIIFKGGGTTDAFTFERAAEVYCDGELSVDEVVCSLNIFPNPSKGQFTLEMGQGNWTVSVYDMMGRCVIETQLESESVIDLSANEKGVYFVKATNGQQEHVQKIVVL